MNPMNGSSSPQVENHWPGGGSAAYRGQASEGTYGTRAPPPLLCFAFWPQDERAVWLYQISYAANYHPVMLSGAQRVCSARGWVEISNH